MDQRFNSQAFYDVYRVKIRMRNHLCGGRSRNENLLADQVKAQIGHDDEETATLTGEALEQMIDKVTEKSWIGFYRDEEKGIYIEARQLKAMIKQCASVLGITKAKRGSKQILHEGADVKALDGGDRIWLGKQQADGYEEGPVHVMTPQGPRTALKRVDYVANVEIEFLVWVLGTAPQADHHIGEPELIEVLTFAQENGLGADRSQGQGKFDVVEFEQVSSSTRKIRSTKKDEKPKKSSSKEDNVTSPAEP